ncbi:MFS transporter [Streptomyces lasalocidi]
MVLLAVAQILVVFDTTVFAVGLPLIQHDRELSFSGLTWLLSAYSVCFAALPVLAGALGRAFGHRRVLMGGFALSSLAAAAPALSSDASVLLAARAVQGVAAAVITAGALALIDATHPAGRSRDRALNVHFAVVACATPAVLLPCTLLLDTVDTENTVFWVQAVAGLVLLALTPVALAETPPVAGRPGPAVRCRAGRRAAGLPGLVRGLARRPERVRDDGRRHRRGRRGAALRAGPRVARRADRRPCCPGTGPRSVPTPWWRCWRRAWPGSCSSSPSSSNCSAVSPRCRSAGRCCPRWPGWSRAARSCPAWPPAPVSRARWPGPAWWRPTGSCC